MGARFSSCVWFPIDQGTSNLWTKGCLQVAPSYAILCDGLPLLPSYFADLTLDVQHRVKALSVSLSP